jgi:hypothetical protein
VTFFPHSPRKRKTPKELVLPPGMHLFTDANGPEGTQRAGKAKAKPGALRRQSRICAGQRAGPSAGSLPTDRTRQRN